MGMGLDIVSFPDHMGMGLDIVSFPGHMGMGLDIVWLQKWMAVVIIVEI